MMNQSCRHKVELPAFQILFYCLALSTFFVASLYIFVPPSVRVLPRDHVLHIKWRSCIILAVVVIALLVYPRLFCQPKLDPTAHLADSSQSHFESIVSPPFYVYLGIYHDHHLSIAQAIQHDVQMLGHALTLYLGYFACVWMHIYHHARQQQQKSKNKQNMHISSAPTSSSSTILIPKPIHIYKSFYKTWMQPTLHSLHLFRANATLRWIHLRNLLFAPFAEEVIFRACILPPLLSAGFSPSKASWIAPLFFGVAHLHHFYIQRHSCEWNALIMGLALQWGYTTLFGAYVSHVLVRTGSLWAVVVIHSFCNYMGLPQLQFLSRRSVLYDYRWIIGAAYSIGIVLFLVGFDSNIFFPNVSVLPALLSVKDLQ